MVRTTVKVKVSCRDVSRIRVTWRAVGLATTEELLGVLGRVFRMLLLAGRELSPEREADLTELTVLAWATEVTEAVVAVDLADWLDEMDVIESRRCTLEVNYGKRH